MWEISISESVHQVFWFRLEASYRLAPGFNLSCFKLEGKATKVKKNGASEI